jgi:hypothetical protein
MSRLIFDISEADLRLYLYVCHHIDVIATGTRRLLVIGFTSAHFRYATAMISMTRQERHFTLHA